MNTNELLNETELNPTIQMGDTGSAVIILQSKLKDLGYYFASITGSFDNYTKNAVIQFQQDHQLTPSGVVDQETWNVLNSLTASPEIIAEINTRPVLRLGSTGPYVTEVQTVLTSLLYYTGQIDGNFGTSTQNAVKRFQTNNRLTPDGIVGRDTWSALSTLYEPLADCNGETPDDHIVYTVVAGDSLWALARRFNTTVDAIKRLNNLTSDTIFVGQKLLIPRTNGNEPTPDYIIYTVVAGDSLWALARRFNTTVDAIKSLNNLTSNNLSIGQQLKIPTGNQPNITYIVVAGDTLWALARRFNTTVDAIKRLNNLTSDNLSIGQQLLIPRT